MNSAPSRGLGRWQATALAISFVVGSGILVLPILSLELAGPAGSFQSWLLMTAIGLPLVYLFYRLSLKTEFTLTGTFSRVLGPGAEGGARIIVLAALLFGMPAMIATTAAVIRKLTHLSPGFEPIISHAILTLLAMNHLRPLKTSTRLSLYTAICLLAVILIAVSTHLGDFSHGLALGFGNTPILNRSFFKASTLTFFGYVGWESLSFFSRDLKDPARDLKWVYGLSFVVVSGFYLALSAVVSGAASHGQNFNLESGILSLLPQGVIQIATSTMMAALLLANLNAWIYGGIKQLDEMVPTPGATKRRALTIYYLAVSVLLLLLETHVVSLTELFLLSNQNWILIYGGVLLFYFTQFRTIGMRAVGIAGVLSFALLCTGCSVWILGGVGVIAASTLISARRANQGATPNDQRWNTQSVASILPLNLRS